jgi:glycosyltransferase involved in cell wall biosynthesis
MNMQNRILFVGALPPPVGGFSAINGKMLSELRRLAEVIEFDTVTPWCRSHRPGLARLLKLVHAPLAFVRFLGVLACRRPTALYLGLSGGIGQALDLCYLFAARIARIRLYVHHHSFSYVNRPTSLSRLVMKVSAHATHLVLCERMDERLRSVYAFTGTRTLVLSNAAFLTEPAITTRRDNPQAVLGYLSNITLAKGIFDFFSVAGRLRAQGVNFQALIAGPLDAGIEAEFFKQLGQHPGIRYLGPVYGQEKLRFFQQIDILIFPTRHQNEAEPVTVLEALACGVPVLSVPRGCIESIVDAEVGALYPDVETLVDDVARFILSQVQDRARFLRLRQRCTERFSGMSERHRARLHEVVCEIAAVPYIREAAA